MPLRARNFKCAEGMRPVRHGAPAFSFCARKRNHLIVLMTIILTSGHLPDAYGTREASREGDPDRELRKILVQYYNNIERHKQSRKESSIVNTDTEVVLEPSSAVPVVSAEYHPEMLESETVYEDVTSSITASAIDYIKEHVRTRLLNGLFGASEPRKDETRVVNPIQPRPRGPIPYYIEDIPPPPPPQAEQRLRSYDSHRKTVDQVFTLSGFILSSVILAFFFFSCIYCWCISSPSRILAALSTILTVFIFLHRMHELFLVFSWEDISESAKTVLSPLV